MKSLTSVAFPAVALAMLVSACSGNASAPPAGTAGENGAKDAKAAETKAASTAGAGQASAAPLLVKKENEALDFTYGYPVEAAAIPALASYLDADAEKKLVDTQKAGNEDVKSAKENNFPVRQHMFSQIWQRVAQTPKFLSLSSDVETYTGGAHGMVNFDSLLWDREKKIVLRPVDIFTSAAAFDAAISEPFCKAIISAKRKKGIDPQMDKDGVFESCPKATEQTIWMGSSDGQALDRLTIGITAYVVGPYAEGSYKIDVPMNAALVRAVKPEYAAFVKEKR